MTGTKTKQRCSGTKKILILAVGTLGILLVILSWCHTNRGNYWQKDNPGLEIVSRRNSLFSAGFSAVKITPEVPDRWTDLDGDAKYNPKKGDTFTDGNGNGVFDPVWIAGFSNSRAANGIHDDLWARTLVLDDGETRLAIVVLDAIGFMHDDVKDVRKRIPSESGITYALVASTHDHESPDLLGLWGKSPLKSGVNREYLEFVKKQIVRSVVEAVNRLQPAWMEVSEDLSAAAHQIMDTRKPLVLDAGLRILKFSGRESGETFGSLIGWANHPETLWSKNLLISSDFPHFVREGVEKGVFHGDNLVRSGTGGVAIYVNGAIGGLMTTHSRLAIKDPFSGKEISEPGFEKARAQGNQLALLILSAMEKPSAVVDSAEISLVTRTITLPVENRLFRLGSMLGILNHKTSGWKKMDSELAAFTLGPVSFATMPGEVFPEIVNGRVEAPEGRDFATGPLEIPPVRELMPGKYKFFIGLANDEIGYIIPKSQWDVKAPYTYGREDSPYGEENSLGPETAPILHRNLKEMLGILK